MWYTPLRTWETRCREKPGVLAAAQTSTAGLVLFSLGAPSSLVVASSLGSSGPPS